MKKLTEYGAKALTDVRDLFQKEPTRIMMSGWWWDTSKIDPDSVNEMEFTEFMSPDNECGTVGCIAGHLMHAEGLELDRHGYLQTKLEDVKLSEELAKTLSPDQLEQLCSYNDTIASGAAGWMLFGNPPLGGSMMVPEYLAELLHVDSWPEDLKLDYEEADEMEDPVGKGKATVERINRYLEQYAPEKEEHACIA